MAIVPMPSSAAARNTRIVISERLATRRRRIFRMGTGLISEGAFHFPANHAPQGRSTTRWKQPAGAQCAVAGTAAVNSPQQSEEPVQQSLGRKHPMSSEVPARRSLLHRYSWLIVLLAMVAMAPIGWSIFW